MVVKNRFQLIVMGGSMGASGVISHILRTLPSEFATPIILVRHIGASYRDNYYVKSLNANCSLHVKEADQLEAIAPRHMYLAPPNYHVLVERDHTLSLSIDAPVHFSRPSIDVLFESAAENYGAKLIGVLLSGASSDGAAGLKKIKDCGGDTIVQDPETAEANTMPLAAIGSCKVNSILPQEEIAGALAALMGETGI